MGLQDPIFLLALEAEWGLVPCTKLIFPLTYIGKGEICTNQMIPWLPYLLVRTREGNKVGSRRMGPNLRPTNSCEELSKHQ